MLLPTITLSATLLALIGGAATLFINPSRLTNRLFFALGLATAGSLFSVYGAFRAGEAYVIDGVTDPVPWLRANAIFGGFLPLLLVMIRESTHRPAKDFRAVLRASLPWIPITTLIAFIIFTPWYIPEDSTHYNRKRGDGYFVAYAILIIYYGTIIFQTWRQVKQQTGIRKLELRWLVLVIAMGFSLFVVFSGMGNFTKTPGLKTVALCTTPLTLLLAYWGICYHRIFDVQQLLSSSLPRLLATGIASVFGIGVFLLLRISLSDIAAIAVAIIIVFSLNDSIHNRCRLLFGAVDPLHKLRQAAIDIARDAADTSELLQRFESLLKTHFQATEVRLQREDIDRVSNMGFLIDKNTPALQALLRLGWATPESLHRRSLSPARNELLHLLTSRSLGVMLVAPNGGPAMNLLVALGLKQNETPYTYPEIERLQNVAELIDNILTRSRLTEQAALQARVEHLAMMSRGLAHDLKNLITPVSSFLIHTEGKYAPDSPEAEVHAAARRSVRIMTDYVREALFFSERLAPKFELVAVPRILSAVVEITASRACRRGVSVATACDPGLALIADNVLLQRMLANFVTNAIDASPADATVTLSAAVHAPDRILVQIVDRGCGIAPEHLPRIFDAYFTTKEFGDEIRGFGLGLTIARKIADLHSATISVKSRLGEGTTIAVDLPARQAIAFAAPAPHCVIADAAAS